MAPAVLDGDPANLFSFFPTYERGAMTIEGYREIVGDDTAFFDFAKAIQTQFAYGNITTAEFIAAAKAASGFSGARLDPAGRLLPAVAVRDDEADDHAGGLRPLSARLGPAAVSRAPVRAPARSSARGRRRRSRPRPR